jgi:hypothetical protein
MISIWHVLILLIFNTITLFAAFHSGFYFGHKNRTGEAPKDTPLQKVWSEFGGLVENITAPKKSPDEVIEEHKANAFYD